MAKRKRKQQIDNMTEEEYQDTRRFLRLLARTRETFVNVQTATNNRLGVKANGEAQDIEARPVSLGDQEVLKRISGGCKSQMDEIEASLKRTLRQFPFYNEWLEGVVGVGPNHAAWIIGEIDIRVADTVSNITMFAGMNPGMVLGRKSVKKSKYRPEMGEIIGTLPPFEDGDDRVCVLTDILVRGDKRTPGFLCPFNSRLRVALLGRLATSMVMTKNKPNPSPYLFSHYFPYKTRLENSDKITNHLAKCGVEQRAWKDVTPGHRDKAARRFMIKAFLKDVYVNWRTIEGLPVRKPYEEEYLGKKHTQRVEHEERLQV